MKRIRVERTAYRDTYTIGKMSVCEDGAWSYMCDTLEDRYRANGMKVKGSTAIPKGTYRGVVDFSSRFKKMMPHILECPACLKEYAYIVAILLLIRKAVCW
jgi:hypothetical protein